MQDLDDDETIDLPLPSPDVLPESQDPPIYLSEMLIHCYIDLYVVNDGLITIRFPDRFSAEVYCGETYRKIGVITLIRHKLIAYQDPKGDFRLQPQAWSISLDPETGNGTYDPYNGSWLPDPI